MGLLELTRVCVCVCVCCVCVYVSTQVNVSLPSETGRRDILQVHLRNTPMASEQDKMEACERLARVTQGEEWACST